MSVATSADEGRVNLLTLLNTATTRKRKHTADQPAEDAEAEATHWTELAKKTPPRSSDTEEAPSYEAGEGFRAARKLMEISDDLAPNGTSSTPSEDPYVTHFGLEPVILTPNAVDAVRASSWETQPLEPFQQRVRLLHCPSVGLAPPSRKGAAPSQLATASNLRIDPGFSEAFAETAQQYRDLWINDLQSEEETRAARRASAEWLVQHILRTRNRVLKTNEYLSKAKAASHQDPVESDVSHRDIRDQGFTRPKVLLLLPLRSSALAWLEAVREASRISTPPRHWDRFVEEYSLPPGSVDKLSLPDASFKYPADHLRTFRGNIDDNFRLAIKWTRKQICLYTDVFAADLIVASPVGLRRMIERDGHADCLSSIEMVIADQLDVMLMQNWDHVNFIFDNLNKIPSEAHDADFSRVKPWYLDARATFLRQTILFSSFSDPEIRSLFHSGLNVAGKVTWEPSPEHTAGVLSHIRAGINQSWSRFPAVSLHSEEEDRWAWFAHETLPALMQSAVASSGGTLIFVPSYFDYLRIVSHIERHQLTLAAISEYSANSDIARARSAFFEGRVSVLIVTERFHFYRRYKIRGAKRVIFYAPPAHPIYYAEFLEHPFVSTGTQHEVVQPEEIAAEVLFCRWDVEKATRILGWSNGRRICDADSKRRFLFA